MHSISSIDTYKPYCTRFAIAVAVREKYLNLRVKMEGIQYLVKALQALDADFNTL